MKWFILGAFFMFPSIGTANLHCLSLFKPIQETTLPNGVFANDPDWIKNLYDPLIESQRYTIESENEGPIEILKKFSRINLEYHITELQDSSGRIRIPQRVWQRYFEDSLDSVIRILSQAVIKRSDLDQDGFRIRTKVLPLFISSEIESTNDFESVYYVLHIERSQVELMKRIEEPWAYGHVLDYGEYNMNRRLMRPTSPYY